MRAAGYLAWQYLRAGVVEARRDGKQMLYRLKDGPVRRLVELLRDEYLSILKK